jgi:hypothetical protein
MYHAATSQAHTQEARQRNEVVNLKHLGQLILPAPSCDAVRQRSALPLRVEHLLHKGLAPRALDLGTLFARGLGTDGVVTEAYKGLWGLV